MKLEQRQKLIDAQFVYLQNLQKKQNEMVEKNVQISNEKQIEENRIKKEKFDKMINDINEHREQVIKMKEEEKRKLKEDDIQFINDYKNRMQKLKEEELKEKINKRLKEKNLAEYQKFQYEQKRKKGLDDFAQINEDAYKNIKRMEDENEDFIKYAEKHIQEYEKQGKNVLPLLMELKKYKIKYCLQ